MGKGLNKTNIVDELKNGAKLMLWHGIGYQEHWVLIMPDGDEIRGIDGRSANAASRLCKSRLTMPLGPTAERIFWIESKG